MPIKKGFSKETVSSNIKEMVRSGHKPKSAIAASLASARKYKKMYDGGMVDDDLDQEHERGLTSLMIQGDQPPIANPEEMDMQKKLAMNLHKEEESEEYYAMGGLVEGMDGDEEPEVMHDGTEEPMSSMPKKPADIGHAIIEGVPMSMGLSEEAKKALAYKKKMRGYKNR